MPHLGILALLPDRQLGLLFGVFEMQGDEVSVLTCCREDEFLITSANLATAELEAFGVV